MCRCDIEGFCRAMCQLSSQHVALRQLAWNALTCTSVVLCLGSTSLSHTLHQVPLRLADACCTLRPSTAHPVLTAAAAAAWDLLATFLDSHRAQSTQSNTLGRPGVDGAVTERMAQQLRELQRCSTLLPATTGCLEACMTKLRLVGAAGIACEASSSSSGGGGGSGSSSSTKPPPDSSTTDAAASDHCVTQALTLQSLATSQLKVCTHLGQAQQDSMCTLMACSTAELSVELIQVINKRVQVECTRKAPPPAAACWQMSAACKCLHGFVLGPLAAAVSSTSSTSSQILQSPHTTKAVQLCVALQYSAAALGKPQPGCHGTGAEDDSSSEDPVAAAWTLASLKWKMLPPLITHLAALTNLHYRVLAWAGAVCQDLWSTSCTPQLVSLSRILSTTASAGASSSNEHNSGSGSGNSNSDDSSSSAAASLASREHQTLDHKARTDLVLAAALMRTCEGLRESCVALGMTDAALSVVSLVLKPSTPTEQSSIKQQPQRGQQGQHDDGEAQGPSAEAVAAPGTQPSMLAACAAELLPAVSKLLGRVVADSSALQASSCNDSLLSESLQTTRWWGSAAGSSVGGSSVGSSSGSTGGGGNVCSAAGNASSAPNNPSNGSPGVLRGLYSNPAVTAAAACCSGVLMSLADLQKNFSPLAPGSKEFAAERLEAAWQHSLLSISTVLESLVRMEAAHMVSTNSSCPEVPLLASVCAASLCWAGTGLGPLARAAARFPAGSAQRQQVVTLCESVLRYCEVVAAVDAHVADTCCYAVSFAAAALLQNELQDAAAALAPPASSQPPTVPVRERRALRRAQKQLVVAERKAAQAAADRAHDEAAFAAAAATDRRLAPAQVADACAGAAQRAHQAAQAAAKAMASAEQALEVIRQTTSDTCSGKELQETAAEMAAISTSVKQAQEAADAAAQAAVALCPTAAHAVADVGPDSVTPAGGSSQQPELQHDAISAQLPTAVPASLASSIPWLLLFGRSLQFWADQLTVLQQRHSHAELREVLLSMLRGSSSATKSSDDNALLSDDLAARLAIKVAFLTASPPILLAIKPLLSCIKAARVAKKQQKPEKAGDPASGGGADADVACSSMLDEKVYICSMPALKDLRRKIEGTATLLEVLCGDCTACRVAGSNPGSDSTEPAEATAPPPAAANDEHDGQDSGSSGSGCMCAGRVVHRMAGQLHQCGLALSGLARSDA